MRRGELKDRAKFFSEKLLGLPYNYEVRFASRKDEDDFEIKFSDDVRGLFYGDGHGLPDDDVLILIAPCLKKDMHVLNAVLIHELIHYKLWYFGYPSTDSTLEFRHEAEKYMVVWDKYFDKKKKKWYRITTPEQAERFLQYEEMYQRYRENKDVNE